jgi:HK97 family phage portal protein
MVDGETAHNFTAFFSGVMQIAQTLGSCPLTLFEKKNKGKEPYTEHAVFKRLKYKANPYMNAYQFKEMMTHHALVWGNGYAKIVQDSSFNIAALYPLYPHLMEIKLDDTGVPYYEYTHPNTHKKIKYEWDEVFHVPGFGYDGLKGYSLLSLHREAIGLGLSQQEFTSRFIGNGAHLSGILKHPGRLSPKAAENLKESFRVQYGGLRNVGKFPVLEEGMEFTPLSMPLEDAQFLESKIFQVQEMARILNIPVYKLKDYSHATYSNVEQLQIEFKTDTIRPWAERWETAIDTQLLTPSTQKKAFAQFDLNAISRGDMATEYKAYHDGRYGGFFNANEIREKLGYNPIEGDAGKAYWMPTNMMDANNPVPQDNNAVTETEQERE